MNLFLSFYETFVRIGAALLPPQCRVCHRTCWDGPLCFRCELPPVLSFTASRCRRCSAPLLSPPDRLCAVCTSHPGPLDGERYLWEYTAIVQQVLTTMKYVPSYHLCRMLGAKLGEVLSQQFAERSWDLIVPIPSTPASLANRGFDQCSILADAALREMVACTRKPIIAHLLSKRPDSKPQTSLPTRRRLANARHSLRLRRPPTPGAKILLIEDVVTTGATTVYAASLLKHAGAAVVDLISLARGAPWERHRVENHRRWVREISATRAEVPPQAQLR